MLDVQYCPNCWHDGYTHNIGGIHVRLKAMYIREGAGGKKWVKVGYYCPKCKSFTSAKEDINVH